MTDHHKLGLPGYLFVVLLASTVMGAWGMHTTWIQHEVAGLAILGLDFLTYIKLLPAEDFVAWQRTALIWSLPLIVPSVLASQLAWASGWPKTWRKGYRLISQIALAILSFYIALQILPLDWSPRNLLDSTNLTQTLSFLICCGLILLAPSTGPWLMQKAHWWLPTATLGCLPSVVLVHFVYLPYFGNLYRQELMPGAGPFFVLIASFSLLAVSARQHVQTHRVRSERK